MALKTKKKSSFTRFKIRAGMHHAKGGRTYKAGQTLVSDKPLHKIWPNKFDIVALNVDPPDEKELAEESKKRKTRFMNDPQGFGKDVTQKFTDALENSQKVYLTDDGEYQVTDENDPYTPLNKKPMSRSEVKRFLSDQ